MNRSSLRRTIRLAAALVAAAGACGVSTTGLGPATDGSAGGAGGSAMWCPAGLTDQAGWPTKTSYTSCSRPCGPDSIGVEACSQTDRATCQAKSGCLCLEAPCVTCGICAIPPPLPDCYVPTNAATATLCADGVSEGRACSPACGRHLCLQADGKTACVCNKQGKYACADWNGSSWQ